MIRRKFIEGLTLAGATSIANLQASSTRTVTFRVKGFTCVTCAVGLDFLISRQAGVVHCKSSYPDAFTTITFNPDLTSEKTLKEAVAELGFIADLEQSSPPLEYPK